MSASGNGTVGEPWVRATIVYDSGAAGKGLIPGWGFSCLVETESQSLLFDTGWDGSALLKNLRVLGKDPAEIQNIFLSHSHWDHIGGLANLLAVGPHARVIVPTSFNARLKREIGKRAEVLEVDGPVSFAPGCLSTGELGTDILEQSLILKTGEGLMVLTGCAHPGLSTILAAAEKTGNVLGVMGGFHDFSDLGLLRGIQMIMPCHCTSRAGAIRRLYPMAYREGGVGTNIELGESGEV
jgi:7,8-dihydropterin-6-yl-methyl-4-(beta-D-ribofuranosyl)aminobenzene 5'-phosphate synthase